MNLMLDGWDKGKWFVLFGKFCWWRCDRLKNGHGFVGFVHGFCADRILNFFGIVLAIDIHRVSSTFLGYDGAG